MWKIKLHKILGNLLDNLRKLYISGTVIKKFLAFLKPAIENSRQFLLFRTDFFQKTVLGCPWLMSRIVSYQLSLRHKWDVLPSCPFNWGSHEKLRESLTRKVTRVRGTRSLAHFHYGSLTWHVRGARNRDKLELLNKRILRFIFNYANSSYDELLKKAKTASLYSGRNHKMLIVVSKSSFFSAYPKYLKKAFSLRSSKYFVRGNNVLSLPE